MDGGITGDWEPLSEGEIDHFGYSACDHVSEDEDAFLDTISSDIRTESLGNEIPRPRSVHTSTTSPSSTSNAPTSATTQDNPYIASLSMQNGLHLAMETRVRKAFEKDGAYGLFSLFVTGVLRQNIRQWTSTKLQRSGKSVVSESELNAYLGLEIAMSICPLNEIADFWSTDRFLRQPAFVETMPRDRFQQIRSALQFIPPGAATFGAVRDPLYRCRGLLQHFQKHFAEIAVPIGASSLDEITVRTKARSRAKTYMPSKPDKYGLRFYAVVGWDFLYVHSLWDNGSGNNTPSTPAERYTELFPSLRTPLYNTLSQEDIHIDPKSATALWIAMAGHPTRTFRSPSGRRLLVSDNFYTRHTYARAIHAFTDGEVYLLGTVRMNLVDQFNKFALEPAVQLVARQERGSWELVAAVDPEKDWEKNAAAHAKKQKNRPKEKRTEYMPTLRYADRSGYIVFKDRKVVVFYSNDLKATMSSSTLPSTSPEAIYCCHGTVPLLRWTGDTIMHRKALVAPALVAAYNRCMNAVDRVDQLRSTNPTRRREKRLHMSVFTWLLDLSIINAYALHHHLNETSSASITLRDFKRSIADMLTRNEKRLQQQRVRRLQKRTHDVIDDVVGADESLHIITPNSTQHSNGKLTCYLCSLRGMARKSKYGCAKCERGFHVACFSAFHYKGVFQTNAPHLQDALEAIARAPTGDPVAFTRKRRNRTIIPISQLTLPIKP